MKKFIRLLGFALFSVLIAFVGLIAYQQNFDFNATLQYFISYGYSVISPLILFGELNLILIVTLIGSIIYLLLSLFLFVKLITKLRITNAGMSLISLLVSLSFILTSINGYYPDANSLENLGNPVNFIEVLLIPIQNPNPGLRASAFSALVVSIVFFTIIFVLMNIIDLFRNPFSNQSGQVIPFLKEDTMIAQELSKFVIPNQIRLPQTDNSLPNIDGNQEKKLESIGGTSILEQTPIVVLPQKPSIPDKEEIVKARQTVLQLKERIRSQIRLELLEAKQNFSFNSNISSQNVQPTTTAPSIPPSEEALPPVDNKVETNLDASALSQIQAKVNEVIAAEMSKLEPKTKDQVSTLINEELIKYDSLNREVMESLVSEKIEQVSSSNFDQFKQEIEATVAKAIQELQSYQNQGNATILPTNTHEPTLEIKVQQIIDQSSLAKKIEYLEQSIKQNQPNNHLLPSSEVTLAQVESLVEKHLVPFSSLLEKVNDLQKQIDTLTQSITRSDSIPFVKQEIFDTQAEQIKQNQQRIIQLQQDLLTAKDTLEQFQIETLSRTNKVQEKVSALETKHLQEVSPNEVFSEEIFVSLLKKYQQPSNQSELPMDVIQGLITNEIKKQINQTPSLTKEEVMKMIDEALNKIRNSNPIQSDFDANKIMDLIQSNLPKPLTETDVKTIVQTSLPAHSNLNEGLVLGMITNEIKKQISQTSSLTKEEVIKMIDEAFNGSEILVAQNPQPQLTNNPINTQRSNFDANVMTIPVIKKKNAKAPENEKRAEQFKSVITPDLGITRTGKKKIIRIPFQERMAKADPLMLGHYDELKNYILSYQVKSRISNTGDMFRLHKEEFVKITIAGKSLKLYLALNPDDYKDSPIPVDDASDKKIYKQIPLVFKVKSDLSLKRAKKLIDDLMAKKSLPQKEIPFLQWSKAFVK
ncbi:MAG: hypothetical protein ACO207_01850 [Bacilli bacterium]